jgi:small-conductance mechanosensitive channel
MVSYTKYLIMSRHQARRHNISVLVEYNENLVKFKYLRKTVKINIAFAKKSGADLIWGVLATKQFINFCVPVCCLKT